MNRHGKYKALYHEADAAFLVFGRDYGELFQNSAHAVFSLITDLRRVRKGIGRTFSLPPGEDALIVFLNELLYLWDSQRFIPRSVGVLDAPDLVTVTARGDLFDHTRHSIRKEVKAVTYHDFSLEIEEGLFRARFILDI